MLNRLLDRLWRLAWVVSVGVVAMSVAYWILDRTPPTRIVDITVRTPSVRSGGELRLDYIVARQRSPCPGTIQRLIVDSQQVVHLLESYAFDRPDSSPALDAPTGQRVSRTGQVTRVAAPVPIGAASGPAQYQAIITYQCNPIQWLFNWPIRVETPVLRFEIEGGDEVGGVGRKVSGAVASAGRIYQLLGALKAQVEGLREEQRESEARSERSRAKVHARLDEMAQRTGAIEGRVAAAARAIGENEPFATKQQQREQRGIGVDVTLAALGAVFGGALVAFKARVITFLTG